MCTLSSYHVHTVGIAILCVQVCTGEPSGLCGLLTALIRLIARCSLALLGSGYPISILDCQQQLQAAPPGLMLQLQMHLDEFFLRNELGFSLA